MNRQAEAAADTVGFGVLVGLKLTILRNLARQAENLARIQDTGGERP